MLKHSVLAVAFAFGTAQFAMAQEVANPTATVYVTGSNLKRTQKEGTQSLQTLTTKDIRDSGATSTTDLMRLIPAMGTGINLDNVGGSSFAAGAATAALRGLGSSSTLVLLNGRRMTPAAYADPNNGNSTLYDLNAIPLSAIERVEVLRDGASAVYGSDAIAGVINFITKSNYQGAEASIRASANDNGLFKRRGATVSGGKGDLETDGYNAFFTADVSKRDRVKQSDVRGIEYDQYRDLTKRYATPYGSTVSSHAAHYRESSPGSENFSANRSNMASRLIVDTDCDPSQQLVGSTAMGLPATSVFVGRTFCNFDRNQYIETQGAGKDVSFLSRGVVKLGSSTRAFVEVGYARTDRTYTLAPITIGTTPVTNFTTTSTAPSYQTILPIGHPDNPFPDARASVAYRFETLPGGRETINANSRLLTGLQGTFGGWDWETGVLYNQSKKDDTSYGNLYLPTLAKLNAGTSLATLSRDPTLGRTTTDHGKASILQWDVRANREFGQLPGGALSLALGAEVRREKLKLDPDPELAAGNIYAVANTVLDGQRDVKSAYAELRAPVLKSVELNFAGRIDKYPDLSRNFVPQIGAKWTVTNNFALRGSFAKGFRAPALSQVTPGGAQFFLSGIWDPKRCAPDEQTPLPGATEIDCAKNIAGTGGANPDLKPERSKNHSIGFVYSPTNNLDIVLDYYRIRKDGEVVLGSETDALKNEDRNPQNVLRDTNPANFITDANGKPIPGTGPLLMVREPWINQGSVQVSGIDMDVFFRKNLGDWGNLSVKLTTSYMKSYTLQQMPGDTTHNLVGANSGIVDWYLSSDVDLPRWKSLVTANLTRGDHAFSANLNYVGPVSLLRKYDGPDTFAQPFCHYGTAKSSDAEPNRNVTVPQYETFYPDCSIKEWVTVGAGYTYTGFKNVVLNLNVQNLFDTKAPFDPRYGTNSSGQPLAGYNASLHNPYGRYYSFNATYRF